MHPSRIRTFERGSFGIIILGINFIGFTSDMTNYLVSLLLVVAAAIMVILLWIYTGLHAYHDLRRQTLPRSEKLYWLVLVIVFPLAGYLMYRIGRLIGRTLLPPVDPMEQSSARGRTQSISLGVLSGVSAAATPPPTGNQPLGLPLREWEEQAQGLFQRESPKTSKPRWRLMVAGGPCVGEEYHISGLPVLIGRGPTAGIPLEMDLSVSRKHAELYMQRGALYIRDLDSQHGVTVNGEPVMASKLQDGDQIGAGASLLVLYEVKER